MSDLIDRQAVDKIIDDLLENDNLQASPSVWHGFHMIKQLPSAQPERKKGKWIETDKHDIYYQPGYKCSVCGVLTTCHGGYCPNCGADMRGEDE